MSEKNEIKENTLIVPIAISGTGKTTFGKMLQKKYKDMKVISVDEIKEKLKKEGITGKDTNIRAFACFYNRIAEELKNGNRVYADSTNLQGELRRKLYSIAMKHKSPIKVLFFNVDKNISKEGNLSRTRQVDDRTIEKQWKQLKKVRRWLNVEIPKEDILDIIYSEAYIENNQHVEEER